MTLRNIICPACDGTGDGYAITGQVIACETCKGVGRVLVHPKRRHPELLLVEQEDKLELLLNEMAGSTALIEGFVETLRPYIVVLPALRQALTTCLKEVSEQDQAMAAGFHRDEKPRQPTSEQVSIDGKPEECDEAQADAAG